MAGWRELLPSWPLPHPWGVARLLGLGCCLALLAGPLLPASDPGPADPDGVARLRITSTGLALEGQVTGLTLPRFAWALAVAALLAPDGHLVLALDSSGGNLDAALRMGRLVRVAGALLTVDTYVGPDASCESACTVLFAAGGGRIAAPSARFMFHAPRYAGADADANAIGRMKAELLHSYLAALAAVDPALVHILDGEGVFDRTTPTFKDSHELAQREAGFVSRVALAP